MSKLIDWLMDSDPSIKFQTKRDLLDDYDKTLQKRIAEEGFAKVLLKERHNDGYLGKGIYSPKWTSLHYVLFDLLWLEIDPDNEVYRENVEYLIERLWIKGIDKKYGRPLDLCISAMILNMACYAKIQDE